MAADLNLRSASEIRRTSIRGSDGAVLQSFQTQHAASIYDHSIQRRRGDVSLSALSLIYGEAIQYIQQRSKGVSELESKLAKLGFRIGVRMIELTVIRDKGRFLKREIRILGILQFVHTQLWTQLYGRPADSIQMSEENENQYMIVEKEPRTSYFMSVPKDLPGLSCEALTAGILEGVFAAALFPAKVTAHSMETEEFPDRTVYVVNFEAGRK